LPTIEREEARAVLSRLPGVMEARRLDGMEGADWPSLEIEFNGDDASLHRLLAAMLEQGLPVVRFSEETQNLEEVFLRATRGIVS